MVADARPFGVRRFVELEQLNGMPDPAVRALFADLGKHVIDRYVLHLLDEETSATARSFLEPSLTAGWFWVLGCGLRRSL